MNKEEKHVIAKTQTWLEQVVVGLNLCPFAKVPLQKKQVRFSVCLESMEEEINALLIEECMLLDKHSEIETTLIICPHGLLDFFDYQQFLLWAEQTLKKNNWRGIYQIASFHPDYTFAGTEADDKQNLTNRAPYPTLHVLREATLDAVLSRYNEPESIPEKNIQTMNQFTQEDIKKYFPYLFTN